MLNFDNLFQESQEAQKLKITIYLENSKQEKRTTFTDGNGQFCFEAKPGNYNIYPVIDKTLNEISFFPQKHSFEITNTPRLDLGNFLFFFCKTKQIFYFFLIHFKFRFPSTKSFNSWYSKLPSRVIKGITRKNQS